MNLIELRDALDRFPKGVNALGNNDYGFCCLGVGLCLLRGLEPDKVTEPLMSGHSDEFPTREEMIAMGFPKEMLNENGDCVVPGVSRTITQVNDSSDTWEPVKKALTIIIKEIQNNVKK